MRNCKTVPPSEQEKINILKRYVTAKTDTRLYNRLKYAGFYRLRLYARFLSSKSHILKTKPSEDVLYSLYEFDEKLRLLLFVFCKKAEISLKSAVSSSCTQREQNSLFYACRESYTPTKGTVDKLTRQKNITYFEYYLDGILDEEQKVRTDVSKYPEIHKSRPDGKNSADRLPADVLFSYLDFGSVCKMYSYLRGDLRKEILRYGYTRKNYGKETTKQFDTWLDAIRNLRNSCAHHNILIGKTSNVILPEFGEDSLLKSRTDLFSRLYALKKVLPENQGKALGSALSRLISHSKTEVYRLGILPSDWKEKYDSIRFL